MSRSPDSERAFAEVTQAAGLGANGLWGMGCAVADYDNDGDLDLYVTYWGPNALYRNEGNGNLHFRRSGVQATGVGVLARRLAMWIWTAGSISMWPTTWPST